MTRKNTMTALPSTLFVYDNVTEIGADQRSSFFEFTVLNFELFFRSCSDLRGAQNTASSRGGHHRRKWREELDKRATIHQYCSWIERTRGFGPLIRNGILQANSIIWLEMLS